MSVVGWKPICSLSAAIVVLAALVLAVLPLNSWAQSATCELCIIEVQTTGLNSAAEDYIVIANNTDSTIDLNGVTIKYFTAGGTVNSKVISLSGSLPPLAVSAFVSSNLQAANPGLAPFHAGLALADSGGTLQLVKAGTIIDEVNWGTITKAGFSGTAAPKHTAGWSLVRKQLADGSFQDTGDNTLDFGAVPHACTGLSFNEVQPFSIGPDGQDMLPSLEILKAAGATTDQDCPVLINGQLYQITAGDLGGPTGLSAIENVLDSQGHVLSMPLDQDNPNDLQMAPSSLFGGIQLPLATSGTKLTQPVLLPGQSYAKFSSGWKQTYSLTPGEANKLTAVPSVAQAADTTTALDACDEVVINELLPNPTGDDAGTEWIELRNLSSQPVSLATCIVAINGTLYEFGPDVFVNPGEYPVYQSFSDGETTKIVNLKNSGQSTISFGRLNTAGVFKPLQTFQYADAPEGQAWARFDDGWRWSQPTPGLDNTTPVGAGASAQPTEFAAAAQTLGDQTSVDTASSPALQITELLPNPAAPETDEVNEYIEIYNPTDQTIDLTGYKLQAGSTYAYSYTIPGGSIAPGEYKSFTSGGTSLALANSAGQVRLVDPTGQTVSETDPYQDAPDGQAWALVNGTWVWTASPTPAAANIYTAPPLSAAAVKAAKKASAKTAKPKAAAKKTAKAAKTTKKTATSDDQDVFDESALHLPILVGVGASALLYAAYEYRAEAANILRKLRRNRSPGSQARQTA